MTLALGVAGLVAGAVSALRWLRVSQREHYIPGSCVRVLARWVTRRPPNQALAALALAAVAGAVAADLGGSGVAPLVGVAALLAAGLLPYPLPVLGRDQRLRPTRRLLTLAAATALLAVLAALALGLGTAAAVVVVAALPLLVDAASAAVRPLERAVAARYRRRALERLRRIRPRVVAITGSYGKTSTKEHVRDLLDGTVAVVASPASWNNEAGLCRAINERLVPGTEVFVAEMGTYGPGEIRSLCSWLRPDVAVITAIGPVHLERMGSLERIRDAKAEILDGAAHAVLAVDDPHLAGLRVEPPTALWRVRVTEPGAPEPEPTGERDVTVVAGDDHLVVRAGPHVLGTVTALHPVNVGCAVAAALALGVPRESIGRRLATLRPPPHRAELQRADGIVVIDDTYNSNPAGAAAALRRLTEAVPTGRRAVVTPGMVELGTQQDAANRELASAVCRSGATLVVVGWTNRAALLQGAGDRCPVVTVRDRAAARRWVRSHLGPGDGVLWENDLPDHYP